MSDYRLVGCENPRTGEDSVWISKDGKPMCFEDIVSDLKYMQEELNSARNAARTVLEAFDIVTENDVLVNMTVESLRGELIHDYPWLEIKDE